MLLWRENGDQDERGGRELRQRTLMQQISKVEAMMTIAIMAMLAPMDDAGAAEGDALGTEGYPLRRGGGGPGSISGEIQTQ